MICPRCRSSSILRNHDTIACLACGHALVEPGRQAWDAASAPRGGGKQLGPAWTEDELLLWAKP